MRGEESIEVLAIKVIVNLPAARVRFFRRYAASSLAAIGADARDDDLDAESVGRRQHNGASGDANVLCSDAPAEAHDELLDDILAS